jgi:hypothetical protein
MKSYISPQIEVIKFRPVVLLIGSTEQITVGVTNPDDEVDAEYAL